MTCSDAGAFPVQVPSASAWASSAANTFSQVPWAAHLCSRLRTPFDDAKPSGRSGPSKACRCGT